MRGLRPAGAAVVAAAVLAAVLGAVAGTTGHAAAAVAAGAASIACAVGAVVLVGRQAGARTAADALPAAAVAASTAPPAATRLDGRSVVRDHEFLVLTLEGRVATARRALRPLSYVAFEVVEQVPGQPGAVGATTVSEERLAATLLATLRESDVVGRLEGGAYGLILEDTGEDGAVWTAERLRRNVVASGTDRIFRAGIASYPTHGLTADELRERAGGALVVARDWRRDRIEVATAAT